MKKKEKRNLILLIIIAVIIITILAMIKNNQKDEETETPNLAEEYVQTLEDGTQLNISKELNQDKEIEGIQISKIQLTKREGETILLGEATNPSKTETDTIGIKIIIEDKEGNKIGQIPGVIPPLKAGESKQLNMGITEDYVNAYNIRIEKE